MKSLSHEAVRLALLRPQGLLTTPEHTATPADVLHAIRLMQYLQIDTIQAVHRSQYLVLWIRLDTKVHLAQKRIKIDRKFLKPDVAVKNEHQSIIKGSLGRSKVWHLLCSLKIKPIEPQALMEALG